MVGSTVDETPLGGITCGSAVRCVLDSGLGEGQEGGKVVAELYVGIIDFLQEWTWKKEAAYWIKSLECDKATVRPADYGKRFRDRFQSRLVGSAGVLWDAAEKTDKAELPGLSPTVAGLTQSTGEVDRSCFACAL